MAEFSGLEEAIVVADMKFPERVVPWRLVQFQDLEERSQEWVRVEEDLPPFFDPSRKKRYSERLCAVIERQSDYWKLRLR